MKDVSGIAAWLDDGAPGAPAPHGLMEEPAFGLPEESASATSKYHDATVGNAEARRALS